MRRRPILFGFLITSLVLIVFGGMLGLALLLVRGVQSEGTGSLFSLADAVAVVEVRGVIMDSRDVVEELRGYAEDDRVKAIVLRIDSPGGGVAPSQEIYDEIRRIRQGDEQQARKPVVASFGSLAASGGYYIASGADLIVSNPGTITGSIGVIMEFMDYQGVYEWIGLKSNVVKTGRYKDIGSGTRAMSPDERKLLQEMIDNVLDQFIRAIVEGRNMEEAQVRRYADGRVFSGEQALGLGFVDKLGNLQTAIDAAAELGGIEGRPKLIYPPRRQQRGWFYMMFRGLAAAVLDELAGREASELRFLYSD